MKKNALYVLVSVCLLSCASHDRHNKRYYTKVAPEKLKKDVKYVKKHLEKMHPDLYWYISREELNRKFDSLTAGLNEALTPNEFYMKLSPVVASVHQGHMSMGMVTLTSPDSLKKKYKGSVNPLDYFEYEYLNDKLYIVKNKSEKDPFIKTGSEIVEINGIKPVDLYNKYRKTLTSDGFNKTGLPKFFARRANGFYIAELGFVDEVNMKISCADSVFHHTVLRTFKEKNKKDKEAEKIASKPADSISKPVWTKQQLKEKKTAETKKRKELDRKKEWYGFDEKNKTYAKEVFYPVSKDSTVAVLKIRGFSLGRIKVYDSIFAEFKKHQVQDLILDLRGNPGGRLSDVFRLSQYLNDSSYVFLQPATITNRGTYFNMFKEKSIPGKILSAPFISIYSAIRGISAKRNEKGELQVPLASSKLKEPKELNYKNRLYVITDGMTFSAAAIISSHLKGRNRAIFVGNETGGTFNGTVAGVMPVLKLPKSKLKLRVGLMTIKPVQQVAADGYGVVPDVIIQPTIEELVDKRDPELHWILNDIESKRTVN